MKPRFAVVSDTGTTEFFNFAPAERFYWAWGQAHTLQLIKPDGTPSRLLGRR